VLDLLTLAREVSGDGGVLAFEMISRFALDLVLKNVAGSTGSAGHPIAVVRAGRPDGCAHHGRGIHDSGTGPTA
jgi:hypothetical protein